MVILLPVNNITISVTALSDAYIIITIVPLAKSCYTLLEYIQLIYSFTITLTGIVL